MYSVVQGCAKGVMLGCLRLVGVRLQVQVAEVVVTHRPNVPDAVVALELNIGLCIRRFCHYKMDKRIQ